MRKYDTCVGHEALINKLLLKKPPGIMSTDSALSVCEQCADQLLKAIIEKKERGEKEKKKDSKYVKYRRRK